MKCLRSSPGNIAPSHMTSGDSTSISKYFGLAMDAVKIESNACVTAINDSDLCESESCRIISMNGCLRNSINDSTTVSVRVSNNNSGVVGDFSTDIGTQCNRIDDISRDHIESAMTIELNAPHTSPVSLSVDGNRSCPSNHCGLPDVAVEASRHPLDVCDGNVSIKNSPTSSLGEMSSALSTMVVTTGESSSVPSVEMPVNGSHYDSGIHYIVYESERQMGDIMKLITKDLSEPYSIYTYRYFIHNWPRLCYLAMDGEKCVGAIVCKLDRHRSTARRGYIAMLAVDQDYRKAGIGSNLVVHAIKSMTDPASGGCDEVVLETEISNSAALRLYEKLGFVRDKRLFRYYLNGVDALRLKLWLK